MLLTLKIKNFALIADQTIEFSKGFNVLVGETGAGKSLILDSLSFVLGDKANKLNLRSGETKMFVQAVFDNSSLEINSWLEQNGIDAEESLILTRTQNVDGKTECRVNGVIVSVGSIKSLAPLLVDVCAQNENIELLKVKNHIAFLDAFYPDKIKILKDDIVSRLSVLSDIESQMSKIGGDSINRERELELLNYQITEIESANLYDGEDDDLKNQIDLLANYEKIYENVRLTAGAIDSVCENIYSATSSLGIASGIDSSLSSLFDRLSSCKIELQDIDECLNDYLSNLDFSQNELDKLESRFDEIKTLKKKYGASIGDIFAYLQKIKNDYDSLLFGEEKLAKLQLLKDAEVKALYEQCVLLSNMRRTVALEIEQQVMNELKALGFKNAKFKVGFEDLPILNNTNFTKNGLDSVEFLLSANAGEDLKSLNKTISGGEMSRFMLALKNVFSKCFNPETLVFDEVDTGISGEIGQCVAERLAKLSKSSQLICITHLCQVSSMADNYIYVSKHVSEGKTFTMIKYLSDEEIVKYIAVASGAEPTEVAMSFALELKSKAEAYKKTI